MQIQSYHQFSGHKHGHLMQYQTHIQLSSLEEAQRVEGIQDVNLDEHLWIVRVWRQVVVHDSKKTDTVGGIVGYASSLHKILVSRRKNLGRRTSNRSGSEAGETSVSDFSTKNWADTASR